MVKTFRRRLFVLGLLLLLLIPGSALAQTYSFSLDQEIIHVFWNGDGTLSLDYVFTFTNDAFASPLDFVDVGLPNPYYDQDTIFADINGLPITDIQDSPYVTYGVALGLGPEAIPPGGTGTVHAFIGTVRQVLHLDSDEETYASAVFSNTWFGSEFVHATTDLSVTFHLPPGVAPEEPRWHSAPTGFPSEPETGLDEDGRITYTWRNPSAQGDTPYTFGASFPETYVPEETIIRPNPWAPLIAFVGGVIELLPFLGCLGFFVGLVVFIFRRSQRRKLQYLPPKIKIEGHGIKRGLTAIEAAILMEQPMEKILTMTLFSVIKKGAAQVISREPPKLSISKALPEDLQEYELDFLAAFESKYQIARRKELQAMMVKLVKSVAQKMKGFSRRETVAYYRDIIKRAWEQVAAADTPEVKSQKYDEVMEWTMLDHDYDDRTRRVFENQPVFIPVWWGNYDPGYRPSLSTRPASRSGTPSTPSGPSGTNLPNLPGADFAASIVTGVQDFSSKMVGNVSEFTRGITNRTNPVPVSTSSRSSHSSWRGGGGHSSCACACACAGCACACAGGGR